MNVFEMAKKYYPRLWSLERLNELIKANKLTEEEKQSIINKNPKNLGKKQ